MSAASEARDRLAALLPNADEIEVRGLGQHVTVILETRQAARLADRLAERDAAVAELDRLLQWIKALCDEADAPKLGRSYFIPARRVVSTTDLRLVLAGKVPGNGCPTCSGPIRETVGMVCQTCGTDYAAPAADHESGAGDG